MKPKQKQTQKFSLAHQIGAGAILLSILAAPFSPNLSAVLLFSFVILCITAPFVPWFSFYLPIISRGRTDKQAVVLTFDDGPDPASTPVLLNLLSKHAIKATFYVTGHRAEKFPNLIHKIISLGHTIGNHSFSHDNLIMLKSTRTLEKEIMKTQRVLYRLGIIPFTFRPPVGVTNPKLEGVLKQFDLYTVNFNRRAGDRGNRNVTHISKKILKRLRSGDIIMLHDIPARSEAMERRRLEEVELLLSGIGKKGLRIRPLTELINRPVMTTEIKKR